VVARTVLAVTLVVVVTLLVVILIVVALVVLSVAALPDTVVTLMGQSMIQSITLVVAVMNRTVLVAHRVGRVRHQCAAVS